eukprot:Unigene7757_Nuclearia_a/m.23815 Unigene7757_Nuclearia_a/g.23815  ORF Unigene7757_Nuclearia_a/g.23815 Unigene7757_Nuclearia_a/m.23815 type:complete len:194 (+) Unigene7757_Nuclearia_a:115-696(+)
MATSPQPKPGDLAMDAGFGVLGRRRPSLPPPSHLPVYASPVLPASSSAPLNIPLVIGRRASTGEALSGTSPSFLSTSPLLAGASPRTLPSLPSMPDKEALARFKAMYSINLPSAAVPDLSSNGRTPAMHKSASIDLGSANGNGDASSAAASPAPPSSMSTPQQQLAQQQPSSAERNRDDAMARKLLTGRMMDF